MTFFKTQKIETREIEIDRSTVSSDSPEVQKRLNRIQENYEQLDSILGELETKIAGDERLKAIDDTNVDFEQNFGIKRKRKWRSPHPQSRQSAARSKRRSANPKKPR